MDPVGGPDAKKARWSPTSSFPGQNSNNGNTSSPRDAFANYGYGPQASIAQSAFNNSPSAGAFAGSPLYSTPSLSINTQTNGNGITSQLSPNTAAAFVQQQQQHQHQQQQQQQHQQQQQQQQQQQPSPNGNGYGGFGAYGVLGMGIPGMNMLNGFPYSGQMGNFGQVPPLTPLILPSY
jgi:hypothetical protein